MNLQKVATSDLLLELAARIERATKHEPIPAPKKRDGKLPYGALRKSVEDTLRARGGLSVGQCASFIPKARRGSVSSCLQALAKEGLASISGERGAYVYTLKGG